ncbi:endonuclease SmrB [Candidatus Erwinia haradaeae]|uniref:Ribosome rescue factor SmrB n=1 Tax=Candidatus Erwinia haradaeae TaxID=1922217 RepID=A0A803GCC4_9GAMM|nr:endonuclease SmrB [Candidatus Erwinia haradaeae]VFP87317.1 UPF0115 protein YfcN [Candidatus Erwinia haradaeae]
MSQKDKINPESEYMLFRSLMCDTRQLVQDTIAHTSPRNKVYYRGGKDSQSEKVDSTYYFSDEFYPLISTEGALRYVRNDVNCYELKKLCRGDYIPDIFLDLHGLTKVQAKYELGSLITMCHRENFNCTNIIHGHGKNVLKTRTPLWLAQHPLVMAFHQAPKQFGGNAALLVLIEVVDWYR